MTQQEKDALIDKYIYGYTELRRMLSELIDELTKDEWYNYPEKCPEMSNMIPGDPEDGWYSDWLIVKGDFMGYKIAMLEFNPYEDATLWKDQEGNGIKGVRQWKHIDIQPPNT